MGYSTDDVFLLRKEKIGWIALICWVLGFTLMNAPSRGGFPFPEFLLPMGWIFSAMWVGMDAKYRGLSFGWTLLCILTTPFSLPVYLLSRRPMPAVCYRCNSSLLDHTSRCQNCCYQSMAGRILSLFQNIYAESADSFAKTPINTTRKTVAYMAVACGIFALLGAAQVGFLTALEPLAFATYWILTAYWVYSDAKWRRMEAMPWMALTLLTNLVGLATYLVIRTPEPATCPQCSAPLDIGLKHCPYCGAETVMVCPRCQSTVQPGWVFCPACASQLPGDKTSVACDMGVTQRSATLSIRGSVIDGERGAPLPGAEVRIDSRTVKESAVTDPVGRYVLADLNPRPYVLIASAEGYVPQTRPFEPDPSKSLAVNFTLSKKPD